MIFNFHIKYNFNLKLVIIFIIILSLYSNLYSQNNWIRKSDFSGVFRINPVSFTIKNKGYFATGDNFGIGQFEQDLWEYNPDNNTWSQKSSFGTSGRINAIGFVINGKHMLG